MGNDWVAIRSANKDPDLRSQTSVSDLEFGRLLRNAYKVLLTRGMVDAPGLVGSGWSCRSNRVGSPSRGSRAHTTVTPPQIDGDMAGCPRPSGGEKY